MAGDDAWTVVETIGDVELSADEAEWRTVESGDVLPPGYSLETGTDGRVKLTRNGDTINVSPDSRMEVAIAATERDTNVGVTFGTLLFNVESRPTYTFGVDTPYLAAVVKGTTFTVTVNGEGAAVHVVEGAVQVSSQATQQIALVRPGQTATKSSAADSRMSVIEGSGAFEAPSTSDGSDGAKADEAEGGNETRESAKENGKGERVAKADRPANAEGSVKTSASRIAAGKNVAISDVGTAAAKSRGVPSNSLKLTEGKRRGGIKINKTVGRRALNFLNVSDGLLGNANAVGNANFDSKGKGHNKKVARADSSVLTDATPANETGGANNSNGAGGVSSDAASSAGGGAANAGGGAARAGGAAGTGGAASAAGSGNPSGGASASVSSGVTNPAGVALPATAAAASPGGGASAGVSAGVTNPAGVVLPDNAAANNPGNGNGNNGKGKGKS